MGVENKKCELDEVHVLWKDGNGKTDDTTDFAVGFVGTMKRTNHGRKKNSVEYPEEKCSCFVCDKLFENLLKFKEHMMSHGAPFSIQTLVEIDESEDKINLKLIVDKDEKKFVFSTSPRKGIKIDQIILVEPPHNSFRIIKRKEPQTDFDVYFGVLSTAEHPHAIFVFYTMHKRFSGLTQYSFRIKQSYYDENIKEEYIKAAAKRKLDPFIKRAVLIPLPDFKPSGVMRSLCRNEFSSDNLTKEENELLREICLYLESGLKKENYVNFWATLLEMEDCTEIEQFTKHNKFRQKVRLQQGYYVLPFPNAAKETPKILPGANVTIIPPKDEFSQLPKKQNKIYAKVYQVMQNNIVLELVPSRVKKNKEQKGQSALKLDTSTFYDFHIKSNRSSMQTMRQALDYVEQQKISKFFFPQKLVSSYTLQQSTVSSSSNWGWINESVKTNPEQQTAIKHIVEKTSMPYPYILMGPPGTGKTTTIVEAVCQIINRDPQVHILIAANSNDAVNVIAHRLLVHLPEHRVHRMFSVSKENEIKSIDPELVKISNLRFGCHYYPHVTELSQYNVILTTLTVAGKFAQAGIRSTFFSYVFIDECGSSTEPATLVPIAGVITSHGTIHGQIILAGDPKQLGPVVKCDKAEPRLGISLLERLMDMGIYARGPNGKYNPRVMTMLLQNYRSHPKILEFSNKAFYNGDLKALGKPELTHWACNWEMLPNRSVPILFENIIGQTQREENSTSMYNMREVDRVIFHIQALLDAKNIGGFKITEESIGVITPYKMQCDKIEDACKKKNWKIDVGSVEKFQGQEKPIMILSTVRSQTHSVGFLNNPKRLNVALTRAQALLIIVGNVKTLETDVIWGQFIKFCRKNNMIKNFENENNKKIPNNKMKNQKKNQWKAKKEYATNDLKVPFKQMQPENPKPGYSLNLPNVPTDAKQKTKYKDLLENNFTASPLSGFKDQNRDYSETPKTLMKNSPVAIGSTVPERNQFSNTENKLPTIWQAPFTPVHQAQSTNSYSSPYHSKIPQKEMQPENPKSVYPLKLPNVPTDNNEKKVKSADLPKNYYTVRPPPVFKEQNRQSSAPIHQFGSETPKNLMNNSTVRIGSTVPILERNQSTSNTFNHQAPYTSPYTPVQQTPSTTSHFSPYDPIKNNNRNEPLDYYKKQPYAPTAPTTLTNSDSNYSPKTPQNNYYNNDLRKSANQCAPNPPAKPKKKSMCLIM